MSFLAPTLVGNTLTVELALKQPTIIRNRIAALADSQIVLDKLFHLLGQAVTAGAFLYNVTKATDYYLKNDVEQVGPGDEFPVVDGVEQDTKMALVEKWGGHFSVPDEKVRRNDAAYLDNQSTQLANTIARKLDEQALKYLEAALASGEQTVSLGNSWSNLVTVGDPATLTPSQELPSANLSAAQLAADLQQLGVVYDLLMVNPIQAHHLRVAYGDKLDAMLKSAGVGMFSNPRIKDGTAYVVKRGQVGILGFEMPLTVETWREPKRQTSFVLAYAMPAFGIDKPYAVKKLTQLG